jgi:hypothetical protein
MYVAQRNFNVDDRVDWMECGAIQRRDDVVADNGAMPKLKRIRERDGINRGCIYPALWSLATNRTKIESILGFAVMNNNLQ